VIGFFLQEAPRRVAALRAAAARGDAKELREVAHALKGSAGQLGARSVQLVASRIEEIGRSGAVTGAAALVEGLDGELQRARAAMNVELEKGRR
jgi:HPt (histidine-containing phosphotransfer) domain-containing protein